MMLPTKCYLKRTYRSLSRGHMSGPYDPMSPANSLSTASTFCSDTCISKDFPAIPSVRTNFRTCLMRLSMQSVSKTINSRCWTSRQQTSLYTLLMALSSNDWEWKRCSAATPQRLRKYACSIHVSTCFQCISLRLCCPKLLRDTDRCKGKQQGLLGTLDTVAFACWLLAWFPCHVLSDSWLRRVPEICLTWLHAHAMLAARDSHQLYILAMQWLSRLHAFLQYNIQCPGSASASLANMTTLMTINFQDLTKA